MSVTQPPRQTSPLADVTAAEAMRQGVLVVDADASLRAVAQIMAAQAVHAVLVSGAAGVPAGPPLLVSDLDLVRAAVEGDLEAVTATEAAGDHPMRVDPGDTLATVAEHMARLDEDHIVVDGDETSLPEGVLSSFDLVAVLAGRDPRIARLVRPRPARPAISERRLDHVAVRDAMHAGVVTCAPEARLTDVAAALADHRVHALAVGDLSRRGAEGVGIVDAMDIVRAAVRWDPSSTAADVAATERVTIEEDADLEKAAQLMAEHELGHLVVVDRSSRPVGVVSTLDVATVCATS